MHRHLYFLAVLLASILLKLHSTHSFSHSATTSRTRSRSSTRSEGTRHFATSGDDDDSSPLGSLDTVTRYIYPVLLRDSVSRLTPVCREKVPKREPFTLWPEVLYPYTSHLSLGCIYFPACSSDLFTLKHFHFAR